MLGLSFALMLTPQSEDAPAKPVIGPEVVVTAKGSTLAQCIEAGCPPELEVEAALGEAVTEFRDGRYQQALDVTRKAVARNKKYAGRMPTKMADLYATQAEIASHSGFASEYRFSTISSVDVLRDHIGANSPTTLAARTRIGDMLARNGMDRAADDTYKEIAEDAAANGQPRIAALVTFRRAWLAFSRGDDLSHANRLLDAFTREVAGDDDLAALGRALRIKIALKNNDDALVQKLMADWATDSAADPVLVYQPDVSTVTEELEYSGRFVRQPSLISFGEVTWVDIGFWVRPSGLTDQVEILRPERETGWAKPIRDLVARRRYAPLKEDLASPGQYRIERYSLRRELGRVTGSRIAGSYGKKRLVQTDLTNGTRTPPQPKTR